MRDNVMQFAGDPGPFTAGGVLQQGADEGVLNRPAVQRLSRRIRTAMPTPTATGTRPASNSRDDW